MTDGENDNSDVMLIKHQRTLGSLKRCYKGLILSISLGALVFIAQFAIVGVLMTTIACIITGLLSLWRIKASKGRLTDNGFVVPALGMSGIIVFLIIVPIIVGVIFPNHFNSLFKAERSEIGTLKKAINSYMKDNDGKLPDSSHWNEILKNTSERYYSHPAIEDVNIENYALNSQALSTDSEIPADMVLLFPSIAGVNQVGGAELIRKKGPEAICVLLADLTMKKCSVGKIKHLKWMPDDDGIIPMQDVYIKVVFISVVLLGFSAFVVNHCRKVIHDRLTVVFGVTVLAAIAGGLMGNITETIIYNSTILFEIYDEMNVKVGLSIGCGVGCLAGLCFSSVTLFKIRSDVNLYESMLGYITLYGAITGIISAITVHILLIQYYEDYNFENLLLGTIFGLVTGVFLSVVTQGLVMSKTVKAEVGCVKIDNNDIPEPGL